MTSMSQQRRQHNEEVKEENERLVSDVGGSINMCVAHITRDALAENTQNFFGVVFRRFSLNSLFFKIQICIFFFKYTICT